MNKCRFNQNNKSDCMEQEILYIGELWRHDVYEGKIVLSIPLSVLVFNKNAFNILKACRKIFFLKINLWNYKAF